MKIAKERKKPEVKEVKKPVLKSTKLREYWHKRAKKRALKEDLTLRDIIEKALKEYLAKK